MGLVALILAVIGAVFACVPGALIIGWVLLPIAFVLALVSLFLKGKKRGMGIAALIISVVGTVIGVVVFLSVVANAFSDSFNQETSGSAPAETREEESEDQEAASAEPDVAGTEEEEEVAGSPDGEGTRENPYPLGAEISSGDWTVTINSVDLDATDAVMAENQFNDAPADGHLYLLVNVTAQYTGNDPEGSMPWVTVEYVSPQGNTFDAAESFAVAPDALDSTGTLYEGASATGNIALSVPAEEVEAGVLSVRPDLFSEKVFVSLD
ncbi:hypothetical protein GCM10009771_25250 [Nesterenkonia flava]